MPPARTVSLSPGFLLQVSTPLALNIYTAVHNPISVKGRLQLCKGALAHVDTRPVLSEIDIPVICIQSTQNNFVKPLHTDPYVSRRAGEVRSIHKVVRPLVLARRVLDGRGIRGFVTFLTPCLPRPRLYRRCSKTCGKRSFLKPQVSWTPKQDLSLSLDCTSPAILLKQGFGRMLLTK